MAGIAVKLAFLFAGLAFAQDAPKPYDAQQAKTDIQDAAKAVEQARERIALLEAKLALYQRGLFACQDAQIESQARAQMPKPHAAQPDKP